MARPRLTGRQRARIARTRQVSSDCTDTQQNTWPGRVIVRHGRSVVVRTPQGESVLCALRQHLDGIACGDQVRWHPADQDQGIVVALEPRRNVLSRAGFQGRIKPLAANITQLIIVLAAQPRPTGYLLDQYLVVATHLDINAVICLNKADLLPAAEQHAFCADFAHYTRLGYPVISISTKTTDGLHLLQTHLADQTSVLVGQSGVGKSSLINALLPQTALEGTLSEATGLGRHTTSTSTLYPLPQGGELIDSPGVRSFRPGQFTRQMLEHGFPELRNLPGQCRFNDCQHQTEPDCAVQAALARGDIHPARLASFRQMMQQFNAS
ncbi:MAG: ribosome small subunit-dependent GTPase A [Pseudomonadota bacterium]